MFHSYVSLLEGRRMKSPWNQQRVFSPWDVMGYPPQWPGENIWKYRKMMIDHWLFPRKSPLYINILAAQLSSIRDDLLDLNPCLLRTALVPLLATAPHSLEQQFRKQLQRLQCVGKARNRNWVKHPQLQVLKWLMMFCPAPNTTLLQSLNFKHSQTVTLSDATRTKEPTSGSVPSGAQHDHLYIHELLLVYVVNPMP